MPPPSEATLNTPLAPSVEKAYYRKCIELKRRLNEVEEANDAARLRKLRLNRAIMKMRLERAFLLEQLAKRLEHAGCDQPQQSPSATAQHMQQQNAFVPRVRGVYQTQPHPSGPQSLSWRAMRLFTNPPPYPTSFPPESDSPAVDYEVFESIAHRLPVPSGPADYPTRGDPNMPFPPLSRQSFGSR